MSVPMVAFPPQTEAGAADELIARLCRQSVTKAQTAYESVPWDVQEMSVDPADPRFELAPWDALFHTAWYQELSSPRRAALGLARIAHLMATGARAENVLMRGLIDVAGRSPIGTPVWRYLQHEVVEESNHCLMFSEFVTRSGIDVSTTERQPLDVDEEAFVCLARDLAPLFFLSVLAVEFAADHYQRLIVADSERNHPLVVRICQVHIADESRHLAFAQRLVSRQVDELSRLPRARLERHAPLLARTLAARMLTPPPEFATRLAIPAAVVSEAYGGERHLRLVRAAARRLVQVARQLHLVAERYQRDWAVLLGD